jgi:adenine-specific DNA-methyltransferase
VKTADQFPPGKLRGGFYTPPGLVRVCLDRLAALTAGRRSLRVLEPSAGDGAFLRGLAAHPLADRICEVTAVEVSAAEAAKCRAALRAAPFAGRVITGSVLAGLAAGGYDAAAGNPPFVRFQFLSPQDRAGALAIAGWTGLPLGGVSNLWIPVFLAALTRLAPGGAFAFIVPAECFTGVSAGVLRQWLVRHTGPLQADLFPPGSFPGVLQEVVVLSGRVRAPVPPPPAAGDTTRRAAGQPGDSSRPGTLALRLTDHAGGGAVSWSHRISGDAPTWTRYLLTPAQLTAVEQVASLPGFHRFCAVGRLTVATVTGANDYFSVGDASLAAYGLAPWALPLLPRIRHAPGLIFADEDHQRLAEAGRRRWLLSFAAGLPSPEASPAAASYLRAGEKRGLDRRYKCRARVPWYRVPVTRPGKLLLSKRSHRFPRLVLNAAGVVTTDTIYQGDLAGAFAGMEADVVAGFHNTVTLLTAEVEGRSFGGGVLELVPTEIGRLIVPVVPGLRESLPLLDSHARAAGGDAETLVAQTDTLVARAIPGLTPDLQAALRAARASLLRRRLARARRRDHVVAAAGESAGRGTQ